MNETHEIVTLFANFINYLNASYYEYHFTQSHQFARIELDTIFTEVSKTPQNSPTLEQCISFYNHVRILEAVTEMNDSDYFRYKRLLRRFIGALTPIPE